MSETSIALSHDTKELLAEEKQDGESFDRTIRRLLGEHQGEMWTEEEIRELIRDELHRQR